MSAASQVTLACAECRENGLAAQCKHMLHLVPQWQSSARHERLKAVMSDRPDLIQSELSVSFVVIFLPWLFIFHAAQNVCVMLLKMCVSTTQGLAFDALQQCFRPADIDAVMTMVSPALEWKQTVYMVVDPAAGGPQSDFALLSFVRSKGLVTVSAPNTSLRGYVCGLEAALEFLQSHLFIH